MFPYKLPDILRCLYSLYDSGLRVLHDREVCGVLLLLFNDLQRLEAFLFGIKLFIGFI